MPCLNNTEKHGGAQRTQRRMFGNYNFSTELDRRNLGFDSKKDLHLIKEEETYGEDEDYYYDYDEEHDQYHTDLQDSYNPAHQTDPFNHYSDHFFADDFMEKGPATRARARRESFKDARTEGFVLSRDDKCNLFIGLLLIIVVTIGVSVPVTLIRKEANEAQNAPTMSPTLVRDSVYTAMLDKIVLEI